MKKFWAVFRREYLERVRSRWFRFATVAGPVFFGTVVIMPTVLTRKVRPSADVSHIVVLDATATDLGQRIVRTLRGGPTGDTMVAVVRPVTRADLPAATQEATNEVIGHQRIGYLVIDSSTMAGSDVYYAGRNASSSPDMDRLAGAVRRSVLAQRLERVGLDPLQIRTLTSIRTEIRADRITDSGRGGSGQVSAIFAYIVAFALYTMILLYGNVILRGVVDEKSTRVAEVVVASAPPDTLLAGKVFGVSAVAVTQVLAWVVTSALVYKARGYIVHLFHVESPVIPFPSIGPGMAVALVLFLVLGFLAYASLFAALGAMVTNQEDAQQASLPLSMTVVCAIVLVPSVVLEPTSTLARVASWFPFTAPILMPVRMSVIQVSWYEITAALLGVAAGCAVAVWLAARIYRIGLLMYGKRPNLRELVHWVRQA